MAACFQSIFSTYKQSFILNPYRWFRLQSLCPSTFSGFLLCELNWFQRPAASYSWAPGRTRASVADLAMKFLPAGHVAGAGFSHLPWQSSISGGQLMGAVWTAQASWWSH